ncbi:sigma-70 family RNA polymerase sigma factor [Oceanirhabdus sp. W0125-5]|uniref:sigma-70 family RNA polymerase sigma factor n=1 Tax=Oceanirhabdus sp. W0125-5 TaxID=2999116 RepID=UPI0022F337F0|nr:sigma-70 family RNA polymerase sigma factor [Oceanirhabdus sp. W0125-5]WBW95252.1 sigma-70 family RNA polymerase sigma factor [Oceanirhabdus sp. W0125-5]
MEITSKSYLSIFINEASKYRIPSYQFEDIVQHGYLTIIKSINLYKPNSNSFNGYAINAIRNNIRYLLRGNIRHFREIPDESILEKDAQDYCLTIEDQIIAYDEVKKLYEALDNLTEDDRNIINEFYFNEGNMKEYAESNNIKYRTLMHKKTQILRKLEQILNTHEKS